MSQTWTERKKKILLLGTEAGKFGLSCKEYDLEIRSSLQLNNDVGTKAIPILNEEAPKLKGEVPAEGPARISFQGYSGGAVDLSDYGFDAPVVYNIENMQTKNTNPILYRHKKEVGHSVQIKKPGNEKVIGNGLLSVPNEQTNEIKEGIRNGFPYQASLSVDVENKEENIVFYGPDKTVKVNGRSFRGPIYVVNNSRLSEVTVTVFARDPETSFQFLNEADRMGIKSRSKVRFQNALPDGNKEGEKPSGEENKQLAGGDEQGIRTGGQDLGQQPNPAVPNTGTNPDGTVKRQSSAGTSSQPADVKDDQQLNGGDGTTFKNERGGAPVRSAHVRAKDMIRVTKLLNAYPDDEDLIEKALDEGWDDTRIHNEARLRQLDRGLTPLPSPGAKPADRYSTFLNETKARLALSFNSKPEFLEKKLGKEVVARAFEMPQLGIAETVVRIANQMGGRFDGFGDIESAAKFLKFQNERLKFDNSVGFSSISLPNILQSVSEMQMEERWELDPPFAPRFLQEQSNNDFRPTQKMRIQGGEPWEKVGHDGTIKHTSMGVENFYTTNLETIAQLLSVTRETLINDDMDVMRDMMDAMIEGAMMTPDIQLGDLMLEAAGAGQFWVDGDNSHTARPLTRANLSLAMSDLMTYNETRGGFTWKNMVNDRFTLVMGPTLQEAAWEILNQPVFVSNTTADTLQGAKNYWYGRLDQAVFPQLGNESLFGASTFNDPDAWFLWPSSRKFSPFVIVYLRGRRRPTIEAIDLPDNILGAGWRGYWDVKVNKRERMMVDRNVG